MIELAAEVGYESVTIRMLARLAGVSTATLYAHYSGKEDCMLATYAAAMAGIVDRVSTLRPTLGRSPARQLRYAIRTALDEFARDPAAARLVLIEVYGAGAPALEQVRSSERDLAEALRASLNGEGRHDVSFTGSRWVTAGILKVARTTLIERRARPTRRAVERLSRWSLKVLDVEPTGLDSIKASWSSRAVAPPSRDAPPDSARSERQVILSTVARIGIEEGYWRLSSSEVRRTAGVTRARFQRHFSDLDECYLEAIEQLAREYLQSLLGGTTAQSRTGTVRLRVVRLYETVLSDSSRARFVFSGILAPGAKGLLKRERVVARYAETLGGAEPTGVCRGTAELTISALWATLADDLERQSTETPPASDPMPEAVA